MFRDAFRERRCIIPASGFYEWTGEKGGKQPHLFTAADGSPLLAFAGLWDRWRDPAAGEDACPARSSCAGHSGWSPFTTACPSSGEKDFDGWLDGSLGPAALDAPRIGPARMEGIAAA